MGGVQEIDVDLRVIAACNADLPAYVEAGKFRKDLYYRLSTVPLRIPPLRERAEDIPLLADAILLELTRKLKHEITLSPAALECLCAHSWPGNVRELRNVLEFAAYLSPDGVISPAALPHSLLAEGGAELTLPQQVRRFEKEEIEKALLRNGRDLAGKKKTAQQLGISLASLYNKLGSQA